MTTYEQMKLELNRLIQDYERTTGEMLVNIHVEWRDDSTPSRQAASVSHLILTITGVRPC